jgi:hypothetical protein
MQPSRLSEFVLLLRDRFEEAARQGEMPVLTSAQARPFVRSIIERFQHDAGAVASGDPSARAAEDGGERVERSEVTTAYRLRSQKLSTARRRCEGAPRSR